MTTETETDTLTARVRAQLLGAGYPESISPDGPAPQPTPATFWPYGWNADTFEGGVQVCLWDQVYEPDRTDAQELAAYAQLTAYADALTAAGLTVQAQTAPGRMAWLYVTAPAAGPEGGA